MPRDHFRLAVFLRLLCCTLFAVAAAGGPTLPSSIGLFSSSNPATLGQALTLTATVPTAATGKVTFYDGATILGIGTLLAGGQARLTTSLLPSGAHSLRAHYSGDTQYSPSDSPPLAQTITPLLANAYRQVSGSGSGFSAVVADFNGDGKADLASLQSDPVAGVGILLGNGNGSFQPLVLYPAGSSPTVLAVGDFNGDGHADLVFIDSFPPGANSLKLLLGNGDGTLRTPLSYPIPSSSVLATGDFNGDGKADLLVGGSDTSSILLGNGDGTFRAPETLDAAGFEFLVADFNGDGKADLAVAYASVAVLLGNGDGTFRPPVSYPASAGSMGVGDFNGDGKPDIVLGGDRLAVLLGNGDGTFRTVAPQAAGANLVAVGDFNGDGKADLVINNGLMLGNGDGTFQFPLTYPVVGSGIAADFNGDGRTDVVTVLTTLTTLLGVAQPDLGITNTHAGSGSPGNFGGAFTITVANTGAAPTAGGVTVSDSLPPGVSATFIFASGWNCILGTLNCTRFDSLAPGASYPPITIQVSVAVNVPGAITNTATVSGGGMSAASKTARDTVILRIGSTVLVSSPNPATLGQAVTLTATETPGSTGQVTFYDGAQVLGIGTVAGGQASFTTRSLASGSHSLYARYDAGANSPYASSNSASIAQTVNAARATGFQPAVNYPVPVSELIVSGDFNGDGKPDLAVAGYDTVSVLMGNGDGTLGAARTISLNAPAAVTGLAVGDFNGDGKADLVVGADGRVIVLLGNGDGTFRAPVNNTADYFGGGRFAVADFNGDGKTDVALQGGYPVVFLRLLPGNGDGTFSGPLSYHLPAFTSDMVVGDFNGDGKPDLAFVSAGVSVQLGNGDFTFQPAWHYSSDAREGRLAIGDFNGDGKPDLVVNFSDFPSISSVSATTVLFGNGDGTFRAPLGPNGLGDFPLAVGNAVADFNGDGKADLIGQRLATRQGNGDGTFQPPVFLPIGAYAVTVGDFNGDGITDLAVVTATRVTKPAEHDPTAKAVRRIGSPGSPDPMDLVGKVEIFLGSYSPRIDLVVWRPTNGTWYVNPAGGAPFTLQWGLPGDVPVAADLNQDGGHYAVWRPSTGTWYVMPSNASQVPNRQWGFPGDIPVPGDYDRDGKVDYAVWRPADGTWHILPISTFLPMTRQLGQANDVPIVADFDGDGAADLAVWRPATGSWIITLSTTGATVVKQWGLNGDVPVAADYDGDGKADFAVWRPSNGAWYITASSNPMAPMQIPWGLPGDIPVPRDYDNDGKVDLALWRPSNGAWYIIPSASPAAPLAIQWGLPGDVPIYRPPGT